MLISFMLKKVIFPSVVSFQLPLHVLFLDHAVCVNSLNQVYFSLLSSPSEIGIIKDNMVYKDIITYLFILYLKLTITKTDTNRVYY